jgi:hypothetical protein
MKLREIEISLSERKKIMRLSLYISKEDYKILDKFKKDMKRNESLSEFFMNSLKKEMKIRDKEDKRMNIILERFNSL